MAMMTREEFLKTWPKLAKDYKPASAELDKIKKVSLLIIIGPSGVGKSALIDRLGIPYVPTDVTRAPRPEEEDGVDMFFWNDYDQIMRDIKSGKFLQVAVGATGDLYATRASSYPADQWGTMPVMADVVPIFRHLGFKQTLSAFVTPPSYEEWMRRLDSHNLNEEQLAKRLAEAKRSLEFVLKDKQTHFILNEDLVDATSQLKQLLAGRIDSDREAAAKQVAKDLLARLS